MARGLPERFLAENKFGKMISDPMTADPASKQHRKFVAGIRVPFAVYTQILEDCRVAHGMGRPPRVVGEVVGLGCLWKPRSCLHCTG